jgi:hypothetical protein
MDEMYNMPGPLTTRVFRFTRARHLSKYYPKDQKWVLRNLTTREQEQSPATVNKMGPISSI